MPQVKPVRVHSCSPSHEKFPAINLLPGGSDKRWKCRDPGEKKAFVVLELPEPTEINGIDIGNEHSCFIEVLVGRQGDAESDFKELLLTSSFQTPNESRNSENPNRVRCFQKAALVESTASQKWQLVKLVCTQPFNSRVNYGVSFVTIYTPEEQKKKEDSSVNLEATKKKGLFSLREDSPDSDSDNNSTSLFARWKQARQNGNEGGTGGASPARVSAAAAIRDARMSIGERKSPLLLTPNPTSNKKKPVESSSVSVRDRNRHTLMYDDDDEEAGNEKLERLIEKDKQRAEEQLKKDSKHKVEKEKEKTEATPAKKIKLAETKADPFFSTSPAPAPSKAASTSQSEPEKRKKPKTFKPFKRLLENVVLTISGIQNPERGNLRAKALEMGAKYRGDWDDSCTHLICAFKNTPKYNQVQGIGKIVRKDWIIDCHKKKRHLPWRRFALDNKEAAKSESEEEIWDERDKEAENGDEEPKSKEPESEKTKTPTETSPVYDAEEDDDDDVVMVYDKEETAPVVICDSGSDTEDEIEKVRKEEKEKKEEVAKTGDSDGKFWSGKKFYFDEDIGAVKIIKCNSIITKFGGELTESKVDCDYWMKSTPPLDPKLCNKNPPIVRPLWLEESNDMECLLPLKRYLH